MIAIDETGFVFFDANGEEHITTTDAILAEFVDMVEIATHPADVAGNMRTVVAVEALARGMRLAVARAAAQAAVQAA